MEVTTLLCTYPLLKMVVILAVIITFCDLCQKFMADSAANARLTYAHIMISPAHMIKKVIDSKYVNPKSATNIQHG